VLFWLFCLDIWDCFFPWYEQLCKWQLKIEDAPDKKREQNCWNLLSLMTETQPSPVTTNSLLQNFCQKKKERIYVATKSDIRLISTPSTSERICKTPTTFKRICNNYTQIKQHALSANHPVDWGVWPDARTNDPNHYDDYAEDDLKRKGKLGRKSTVLSCFRLEVNVCISG
jgi:hypothetical protein